MIYNDDIWNCPSLKTWTEISDVQVKKWILKDHKFVGMYGMYFFIPPIGIGTKSSVTWPGKSLLKEAKSKSMAQE